MQQQQWGQVPGWDVGFEDAARQTVVASSAAPTNLQELKNPSRVSFEAMYAQLAVWHGAHGCCHVPRNCFDAPPLLAAWTRHMRRLHAAGKLPTWQRERLDLLAFEWSLSKPTAAWIHTYHELRRYKALHGHLDFDPPPTTTTAPTPPSQPQHNKHRKGDTTNAIIDAWSLQSTAPPPAQRRDSKAKQLARCGG
jgi:hypothetical protein